MSKSLEKVIPIPWSLHQHLHWQLDEDHVLSGQPLHPLQRALQIFTDTSNEGCGAHLRDYTAQGVWSIQESQLHINFLELKAVLQFEHLCLDRIVLIASDITVVSNINKALFVPSFGGSILDAIEDRLSWKPSTF